MQSLIFIILMVSEKILVLKFQQAQAIDRPKTCQLSRLDTHQSFMNHTLQPYPFGLK